MPAPEWMREPQIPPPSMGGDATISGRPQNLGSSFRPASIAEQQPSPRPLQQDQPDFSATNPATQAQEAFLSEVRDALAQSQLQIVPVMPQPQVPLPQPGVRQAMCLWDFHGQQEDELSFSKGEVLKIHGPAPDPNWYDADNEHGLAGLVPSTHIRFIFDSLGLAVNHSDGVYSVRSLLPGGAALDSNLLQPGDIIHSIDGVRLFGKSSTQVRDLVQRKQDTGVHEVQIVVLTSDARPEDIMADSSSFNRWRLVICCLRGTEQIITDVPPLDMSQEVPVYRTFREDLWPTELPDTGPVMQQQELVQPRQLPVMQRLVPLQPERPPPRQPTKVLSVTRPGLPMQRDGQQHPAVPVTYSPPQMLFSSPPMMPVAVARSPRPLNEEVSPPVFSGVLFWPDCLGLPVNKRLPFVSALLALTRALNHQKGGVLSSSRCRQSLAWRNLKHQTCRPTPFRRGFKNATECRPQRRRHQAFHLLQIR